MQDNRILLKYFSKDNLSLAWNRMIRSTGKDSKDYFGIKLYSSNLDKNLEGLSRKLINGKYKPQRPFKYYEPKASKTHRTKSVLFIDDSIIYQAIADHIASKNYTVLTENSDFVFGSVLHLEVKKGTKILKNENSEYFFFQYYLPLYNKFINSVNNEIENLDVCFKLETDITGFFDCIPHSKFLFSLNKYGVEPIILDLLNDCLNVFSGTKDSITPGVGIPQGPAASFFFANLFLNELDHILIKKGFAYYRYMDDIRIYEESEEKLTEALVIIDNYLKGRALSLNTKKTSIQEIKDRESEKLIPIMEYAEDLDSENVSEKNRKENMYLTEQNPEIDQEKNFSIQTIEGEELINFCKKEVKNVEDILIPKFTIARLTNMNLREFNEDEFFKREIINLAYRWRSANSILKNVDKPILNKGLISIWLYCLEHFFWKANHFCWNLNQYGPNQEIATELNNLLPKFKNFEWVRFQILSNMAFVQEFTAQDLRNMFRDVQKEESSLVRIGYYMVLLKNVNMKSQLYATVLNAIKSDPETYIKRYLTSKFFNEFKKDNFSEIKFWFGL